MLDALDITEAEAQGLSELAQHDLALARDFARRAQAAEDADEASRLGRSYQRAARSYRQTLALKARLKRDLAAAAKDQAGAPKAKPGGAAVARRIGELRAALLRLAWDRAERTEVEPEEGECAGAEDHAAADRLQAFAWVRQDLEAVIARDVVNDSFGAEPLDDHVARVALRLGMDAPAIARWRDLPDPPDAALAFEPDEADDWDEVDDEADDENWESSA